MPDRRKMADQEKLRRRIDAIDAELVRLLAERAACAQRIGCRKRVAGEPLYDRQREAEVLTRVRQMNRGPLSDEALDSVYRRIMAACLELEESAS